jgi:hypothetical protein
VDGYRSAQYKGLWLGISILLVDSERKEQIVMLSSAFRTASGVIVNLQDDYNSLFPPSNQVEAVVRGPNGIKAFKGTFDTRRNCNGELITVLACHRGAPTITALHEAGVSFDAQEPYEQQDIFGISPGMRAAEGGAESMRAFYNADGRFSNKLRSSYGKTDASFVPIDSIDTFFELGGTFFDDQGNWLKDNDGNPSYTRHSVSSKEFKAAVEAALQRKAANATLLSIASPALREAAPV